MNLEDLLLISAASLAGVEQPELDPLTERDALQEAQLLDVRFDALTLTVGLLFELRTALQLRRANTGVMSISGVRRISWRSPARPNRLTAWSVGSSLPRTSNSSFSIVISLFPAPGAELTVIGDGAAFFSADVIGLGDVPPDYGGLGDGSIRNELANWQSEFVPVSEVFLNRG